MLTAQALCKIQQSVKPGSCGPAFANSRSKSWHAGQTKACKDYLAMQHSRCPFIDSN